jgi:hypothetical protein
MRNLHLNTIDHSLNNQLSGQRGGVLRRQFLKTVGMVGVGLTLWPKDTLAIAPSEADDWIQTVLILICAIFDCRKAEELRSLLYAMGVHDAPAATTFHERYRVPYLFGRPGIDPVHAICQNGFQITGYPYYDAEFPCRNFSDLNHAEIMAIASPHEIQRFDCVLTATGSREPLEANDHAVYQELLSHYKESENSYSSLSPRDWTPIYKRKVSGHGKAHTGFHIIHNTKTNRFGKPKSQFIVAKDI